MNKIMDSLESKNKKYIQEFKAIVIGSIITFIVVAFYNGSYIYNLYYYSGNSGTDILLDSDIILFILALLIIIAGFTIAYINKPKYKTGIIIVLVSTVIGIYLASLLLGVLGIFSGLQGPITIFELIVGPIFMVMLYCIPVGLLGIFGVFIGTSIKKLKNKYKS